MEPIASVPSVSPLRSGDWAAAGGAEADPAPGSGTSLLDRLSAASPLAAATDMAPVRAANESGLHDTLAPARASALDLAPADAPPPPSASATAAPEPPAPSSTLQQMAQAATHIDLAAQRHGERPDSAPVALAADVPTAPTPLQEALLLAVPVMALQAPAMHLRADGREPHERPAPKPRDDDGRDEADAEAEPESAEPPAAAPASARPAFPDVVEAQLYRDIVATLRSADAHPAVRAALDELPRLRRIVVATPEGARDGLRTGAAVHVLLPRAGGGRALRLAGELLWAHAGVPAWLDAHLVRTQADGSVRRLVPLAADGEARRVAVTLGAQAVPMTAWSSACLRVRDGTRLWQALDPQWSLRLLVGTAPLALGGGR